MTNNSFSKITDLLLPATGRTDGSRTEGRGGERRSTPEDVQRFEHLLKSAGQRRAARPGPAPTSFDRPQPDVRTTDRQPVIDRPTPADARRPERPERPERDDRRADGSDRPERAEDGATNDRDRVDNDDRGDDQDNKRGTAENEDGGSTNDEERSDGGADDGQTPTTDQADTAPGAEGEETAAALAEFVVDDVAAQPDEDTEGGDTTDQVADPEASDDADEAGSLSTTDDDPDTEVSDQAAAAAAAAGLHQDRSSVDPSADTGDGEIGEVEATAADVDGASGAVGEEAGAEEGLVQTADAAADETADEDADPSDPMTEEQMADGETSPQDDSGQGQADADATTAQPIQAGGATTGQATTTTATATVPGGPATPAVGETTTRTAAAPAAQAAPVVDAEDGDMLWRQVRRAIGSMRTNAAGDQQLTIRLRPAELGSIMIRMTTGDAGTTVALVAESAAAASQLNQQRQQLISELEDSGLADVAVDVGTNEDPQNQTDGSEDEGENSPGLAGGSTLAGAETDPGDRFRSRRTATGSAGLVDVDL